MTGDCVAQVLAGFLELFFNFQPIKIHALPAFCADQQVLVAGCASENGLAMIAMVNPVNQAQFFELFNGAVNCHQPDLRKLRLSLFMHFLWGERTLAAGDHTQDHLPWPRDTPAAEDEFMLPCLADLRLFFHIYLIENGFQ